MADQSLWSSYSAASEILSAEMDYRVWKSVSATLQELCVSAGKVLLDKERRYQDTVVPVCGNSMDQTKLQEEFMRIWMKNRGKDLCGLEMLRG